MNIMDDNYVRQKLWNQLIKVSFRLSPDQIAGPTKPESLTLDVPRNSYFPLIVEPMRQQLAPFVKEEWRDLDLRVEYCGIPLRMHRPIGVSYDLLAFNTPAPWILTIKFQGYRNCEILYSSRPLSVKNYYIGMVKKADELKHKGKVIRHMTHAQRDQLWSGVFNHDCDQFWSINQKLMKKDHTGLFRNTPFCLYQLDKCCIETLYSPTDATGKIRTIQDLIETFASEILSYLDNMLVLCQGYCIPNCAPLQDLSEIFSYPDNFLHICLIPKS